MVRDILVCDEKEKRIWCPRCLEGGDPCDPEFCFRCAPSSDGYEALAQRDRYNEIFAEMFGCGMIYADYIREDSNGCFTNKGNLGNYDGMKSYFRHCIAHYSLDASSVGGSYRDMLLKLAEVLTRCFLASYPYSHPNRNQDKAKQLFGIYGDDKYVPDSTDVEKAAELFWNSVEDAKSFFYLLDQMLDVKEAREYINRHFRLAFMSSYEALCCIWLHVHRILKGVFFDLKTEHAEASIGTNPLPANHWALVESLYKGYRGGRPIIRLLYSDPRKKNKYPVRSGSDDDVRYRATPKDIEKRSHLDAFFVVRHMLRFHLHSLYGAMDNKKEIYYLRNVKPKKEVNEQLIDRFDSGLFSVSFKSRADYMRDRIVVMKTFWDLSTNIRGRVLRRIIDQVLSIRSS